MARKRRRKARRHNPRRRRHGRRRNPSFLGGGIVSKAKGLLIPAAAGVGGGFVGGFVEAKLSKQSAILRKLGQLAAGIGGGILVTRFSKNAVAGGAFLGGVVGSIGRTAGATAGGGLQGAEDVAALAEQVAGTEDMALLMEQMNGFGLILGTSDGQGAGFGAEGSMESADLDGAEDEA